MVFYCCVIESIHTNCISVHYDNHRKAFQRVAEITQRISGTQLPIIDKQYLGRERNII